MKQLKWVLLIIVIASLITFLYRNQFIGTGTIVKNKDTTLAENNYKNLDSLSVQEIRTRYLNNPCYLALLKDPNMWEKGTKAGFDYRELINDSLSKDNPFRNRFIVGDFNSVPLDGGKSGIYEVYPSLTSLSEFKSFPKTLLEKLDTTVYSDTNLESMYADIKTNYGSKGERLINFIEKVWKYKIIPISSEYSINGEKVYAAGQVLVLCEACKDTLKLVGKFATSAKRQDFMFKTDENGIKHKVSMAVSYTHLRAHETN
jgi:hypothetical protein